MLFQVVVSESESHATRDSQVLRKGIALSKSNLFSRESDYYLPGVNETLLSLYADCFLFADFSP